MAFTAVSIAFVIGMGLGARVGYRIARTRSIRCIVRLFGFRLTIRDRESGQILKDLHVPQQQLDVHHDSTVSASPEGNGSRGDKAA